MRTIFALAVLSLALLALSRAHLASAAARSDVAWIAAGSFTFGARAEDRAEARRLCVRERLPLGLRLGGCARDEPFAAELPARRVFLPRFGLDRHEVSRAEHTRCVEAGGCDPSACVSEHPDLSDPSHPVVGLRWGDAEALCRYRGGRLPSEAEWERGARGDSLRPFPWGHHHHDALANQGAPSAGSDVLAGTRSARDGYAFLAPVAAFAAAHSPHGLVQAAGNVWEWTADAFVAARGGDGLRAVRGGSYRTPALALRVTHREGRAESRAFADVGVRCAYDGERDE